MIHHSGAGVFALRRNIGDAGWKLVVECPGKGPGDGPVPGSSGKLYDLSRDLAETTNLWHHHPNVVRALTAYLVAQCSAARSVASAG